MDLGRRLREEQEGAAAVEFALISSLLVIILFAITAFGQVFSANEAYTSAAREGARLAATRCSPTSPCSQSQIAARVTEAATGYAVGPGSPAADITCSDSTVGSPVTVSWTQHLDIKIPFLPDMSRDVSIKGVFRCE